MRKLKTDKLAVIGGGSVGPMFVIMLANAVKSGDIDLNGFTLHLIDPNQFCNGGIAYGKCSPKHILNTQRKEMSPWQNGKFEKYLKDNDFEGNEFNFEQRATFLGFIQIEYQDALATLRGAGAVIVEHKEYAYIKKTGDKFKIVNDNQEIFDKALSQLPADEILLTVGYGVNNLFKKYWDLDNFVSSMYPPAKLESVINKIKQGDEVMIIGSRAALYDFVMAYDKDPDLINLTIVAPGLDGPLEVREVESEHLLKELELKTLKSLTKEANVQDITAAIEKELEYSDQINAGPRTWPAFRIMMEIGKVLDLVSTEVATQYRRSDQFIKLQRLGGPTTSISAARLEEFNYQMFDSLIYDEDISINQDGTFDVRIQSTAIRADYIINATGHGRHNSPILDDLKKQGLAEINPNLGILKTRSNGYTLEPSEIACVGPATHFGTDGIETFAQYLERYLEYLII